MADTVAPEAAHQIPPEYMPPPVPPMPAEAKPAEPEEETKLAPPITDFPLVGGGLNPIIDEYNELIALAIRLQTLEEHKEVDTLYQQTNQQIQIADIKLRKRFNYSESILNACRYAVCCLLDEIALNKTWSEESQWQKEPLVKKQLANTLSAHKFYDVLKRLLKNSSKYREAIETFYLCLLLGFKGSASQNDDNSPNRENIIEETQTALSRFWRMPNDQLSQYKKYLKPKPYQIEVDLPLWPIYLITLITLVTIYWVLKSTLDADMQIIIEQLNKLGH